MLKLESLNQSQTSFWIVDDMFTIGQSAKNQMQLLHDDIFPTHAKVTTVDGQLVIEPYRPDAKVSVNYMVITEPTPISVGDMIALAGIELKLIDPSARQPSSKPISFSDEAAEADTQPQDIKQQAQEIAWKIQAVSGAESNSLIEVNKVIKVGRDPSNDIVISGNHISRRHAELYTNNGQLLVRDLDSSNGTCVNGERVKERAIFLGDEVRFDSAIFRVAVGRAATLTDNASNDKTQFRAAITAQDLMRAEQTPAASEPAFPSVNTTNTLTALNSERINDTTGSMSVNRSSVTHANITSVTEKKSVNGFIFLLGLLVAVVLVVLLIF